MEFRDKRLGAWLIEYVKNLAFELATSQLGVRFVTIDAYQKKEAYYAHLGFVRNEALMKDKRRKLISMRADIFD